jgi:hypothetical protein
MSAHPKAGKPIIDIVIDYLQANPLAANKQIQYDLVQRHGVSTSGVRLAIAKLIETGRIERLPARYRLKP